MTKLTFEMSEDARLLSQQLLAAETGVMLEYPMLSKIIGKPIISSRGALQTARRHALREEGIVFGVVRGVGLKRLSSEEIVSASASNRKCISNKAKRSAKELNAVDYAMLTSAKQLMATATMSVFIAIQSSMKDRSIQAVQVLGGSARSLPIKETLEALLRSQGA